MLVTYQGQPAALVTSEQIHIAPPFDELPTGHATLRFIAFMALYARDVQTGQQPGPYNDEHAELFARCALIDPAAFWAELDRPNDELAQHFQVPVEQIALRRHDLALNVTRQNEA